MFNHFRSTFIAVRWAFLHVCALIFAPCKISLEVAASQQSHWKKQGWAINMLYFKEVTSAPVQKENKLESVCSYYSCNKDGLESWVLMMQEEDALPNDCDFYRFLTEATRFSLAKACFNIRPCKGTLQSATGSKWLTWRVQSMWAPYWKLWQTRIQKYQTLKLQLDHYKRIHKKLIRGSCKS